MTYPRTSSMPMCIAVISCALPSVQLSMSLGFRIADLEESLKFGTLIYPEDLRSVYLCLWALSCVCLSIHHIFRFLCICWQITWKEWHKNWHVNVSRWYLLPLLAAHSSFDIVVIIVVVVIIIISSSLSSSSSSPPSPSSPPPPPTPPPPPPPPPCGWWDMIIWWWYDTISWMVWYHIMNSVIPT